MAEDSAFWAGEPGHVTLWATTTVSPQTVTLQRITPTGANTFVDWGDGSLPSVILNGAAGTTTHSYALAGTYIISIYRPSILTYIDLRDTSLGINSSTLTQCTSLASLRIDIGGTFNSADIVGLPLTYLVTNITVAGSYIYNSVHISAMALTYLGLNLTSSGTYIFNSSHISSMALTSLTLTIAYAGTYTFNSSHITAMPLVSLYLVITTAGTYAFNSVDISAKAITYLVVNMSLGGAGTYVFNSTHISTMALTYLIVNLTQSGTYTIDSAHIATMSTITNITFVLNTTNTFTIARADWDGFPACGTIRVEAALIQAEVDNILLGLYDGFATKTVTGGTVDLLGQSNAAPSGVLHAECPPLDGKAAAFELVNDSCGVSTKHWTTITTA